jgi:thiamine biosynthesis lipoprotein
MWEAMVLGTSTGTGRHQERAAPKTGREVFNLPQVPALTSNQEPLDGGTQPDLRKIRFPALGTTVELAVIPAPWQEERVDADLAEVQAQCLAYHRQLSRFDPDSEISRLNRGTGKWVPVSDSTAEILRLALALYRQSGGMFHPAVGAHLNALGYNRSFELVADNGDDPLDNLPAPQPLASAPYILRQWQEQAWGKVTEGLQVDLGGIAKGWIVEQGARLLIDKGYSRFVYNAGGDMICQGSMNGRPWRIGIANPFRPTDNLLVLEVESLAVATSGTYRRSWIRQGRRMHHLVDPRTGLPAETDVVSCTVVAKSLVAAEWMAKTVIILGSGAIDWLASQGARGWVVVTNTGEVKHAWNSSMSGR